MEGLIVLIEESNPRAATVLIFVFVVAEFLLIVAVAVEVPLMFLRNLSLILCMND